MCHSLTSRRAFIEYFIVHIVTQVSVDLVLGIASITEAGDDFVDKCMYRQYVLERYWLCSLALLV